MTDSEVIEVLEKEESYMLSHGGDRQAKALRIAIDKMKQEPFINKPCVSEKQCEHDKNVVLDKIRAEVESIEHYGTNDGNDFWLRTPDEIKKDVLAILDKYKAENEKT